ncbi:hypothetical protein RA27_07455 [Ruegeria sp. ANG-R]|uniref:hypothetical protein n=1 Tax=Ruegeria sp. ANG-R TaxID=1577903 RepID=UPI0005802291|nr:hypothetical protein [Ruegeria sp. ANG-R]KIC43134.1 hypothetical protein RA27_07455 [Ruegeria sp. ANG-R]
MNPVASKVVLIVAVGVSICLIAYRPDWLSDNNEFLKNFVNHEYLNILGVILAITLASLSQLHLSLSKLKSRIGDDGLDEIKAEIKSSAAWLIGGFLLGLVAVILKPLIVFGASGEAAVNAFSMIVLLFYILVLSDITLSVFDIDFEPISDDDTKV